MSSQEKTSLSIRIGDAEFSAEGPAELVNAQFQAFLAALQTPAATHRKKLENATGTSGSLKPDGNGREEQDRADGLGGFSADSPDPALIQRVFLKDSADRVSLKVLPSGGAPEALLLVLYGMEVLAGEDHVTGASLMKSMEKSGVKVDRIDRHASPEFISSSGMRRAKRYGLNNRGKREAYKILSGILG